jgi:hypothetical protein
MKRSRGYEPFGCSVYQDIILDKMLSMCSDSSIQNRKVAIFDLDGCLFDTRHRQIMIFREFAARHGIPELFFIEPHMITDWNLRTPLQQLDLSDARIDSFYKKLSDYWWTCFFHSDYVRMDYAMPAACDLVKKCYDQGVVIVYLTGRDHSMRVGTEEGLRAFGFPYDMENTYLITKPEFAMPDTQYKKDALQQIKKYGTPVIFIDNEPSNVNMFHQCCPDALVVFIETDHSPRQIEVDKNIPWIRSFVRRTFFDEQKWLEHEALPLLTDVDV